MNTVHRAPAVCVVVVSSVFFSSLVQAGFVNGRENFSGVTMDTAAWEAFNATIVQNNGLTINTMTSGSADYTTRNLTVGPGQIVRVPVTINQANYPNSGAVYVLLTDNSAGTSGNTFRDDSVLGVADAFNFLQTVEYSFPNGYGFTIAPN